MNLPKQKKTIYFAFQSIYMARKGADFMIEKVLIFSTSTYLAMNWQSHCLSPSILEFHLPIP